MKEIKILSTCILINVRRVDIQRSPFNLTTPVDIFTRHNAALAAFKTSFLAFLL